MVDSGAHPHFIEIFVRILYAPYASPDNAPIMMPKASNFKPPITPDTRQQPISISTTDISLRWDSFSPRNSIENIITYIGAVYIRMTAVEIDAACIEET